MSLVCRSVKALCRGEELCAPREKALCTGKSSVPQKTGRLSQKAQLFAVLAHGVCARHEYFKHSFLQFWHTAFAQDMSISMPKRSSVPQKNRHNYPKNSAQAEFLCFCTRLLVKHEFPDAKAKLCAPRGAEVTGERGSSVYDFSINLFARKIGDAPKICFGQKKNDYFPQVNSLFSPGK